MWDVLSNNAVQRGKDLLSFLSRYLYQTTVNPFKEEIYIYCGTIEPTFYLRIRARICNDRGRDLSDGFCYSYLSVGGFITFNDKPNKSIEPLEIPLDSRLISSTVMTGFLMSDDMPQIIRNGRIITKEEYEAARSKSHRNISRDKP